MKKWSLDWNYWDRYLDDRYFPSKDTPWVASTHERPEWDVYLMGLAILASKRSSDPTTHHGAILADKYNRVISTGYNSPLAGLNPQDLPSCRVDENFPATKQRNKYRWMRHAEENMLLQAPVDLKSIVEPRVYITGRCCLPCSNLLISAGITHWILLEKGDQWGQNGLLQDTHGETQDWLWLVKKKNINVEWMLYDQKDFQWVKEAFNL